MPLWVRTIIEFTASILREQPYCNYVGPVKESSNREDLSGSSGTATSSDDQRQLKLFERVSDIELKNEKCGRWLTKLVASKATSYLGELQIDSLPRDENFASGYFDRLREADSCLTYLIRVSDDSAGATSERKFEDEDTLYQISEMKFSKLWATAVCIKIAFTSQKKKWPTLWFFTRQWERASCLLEGRWHAKLAPEDSLSILN